MNLEKIRNSKFGWALGISLFAVWFFFVVSFVVGLLILPIDLFAGNKDLVEVTLAVILPVILVVGSILLHRSVKTQRYWPLHKIRSGSF